MGVQDYDDLGFQAPDYYDPDEPFGPQFGTWPTWTGLMDRAQSLTFTPVGLRHAGEPVPTYAANGNHDGLVQGNEDAIRAFEEIATGCSKVAGSTAAPPVGTQPDPTQLLSPGIGFAVRPDDARRFVDRVELKRIYSEGIQRDGHGFGFVDGAELAASGFAATYWARDLKPGIRFISLDTVSEGGVVEQSATGNIDDPQWRWLERELDEAEAQGKLVIAFGHHPVRNLTSGVPDEARPPVPDATTRTAPTRTRTRTVTTRTRAATSTRAPRSRSTRAATSARSFPSTRTSSPTWRAIPTRTRSSHAARRRAAPRAGTGGS